MVVSLTAREAQLLQWISENPLISQQELADRAGITRSSAAVHISNLMKKGFIDGKGYIVRTAPYVAVVGAVNMDIGGRPSAPLVPRDSNPGRVRMSLGGVGRNIAHNMSLLGLDVRLVTAFGDDVYAHKITASCNELGIDISQSLQVPGAATSTYLFITEGDGDMAVAVSDMEIYEHITPAFLAGKVPFLNNARLVVIDANLPAESIAYLAEHCKAPLFVDPVSTAKAKKLAPILGRLHTLKPNRMEAELLSGVTIRTRVDVETAARALLDTGLERVFISMGEDGVYAAQGDTRARAPCFPARMVNTTGCGDAFMAALAWAFLAELGLCESAMAGEAAAAIAMEGEETINGALSAEAVRERVKG